jgi:hypothetical protein
MTLTLLHLAPKIVIILGMLAIVVFLFEKIGEKFGFFLDKPSKKRIILGGLVVIALFNIEPFIDHEMIWSIQAANFSFSISFVPFACGLWREKKVV